MDPAVVAEARRVAETVLLPDAEAVDAAAAVPRRHLDALDAAGLTGHAAADPPLPERVAVTALLAGACMSTAFVWIQHQGALAAVGRASGPAARFAPDLASGRLRAGVVITAVLGPRPLRLHEGRLTGTALWVTGWGIAEVLRVAAIDDDGAVTSVLVDVGPGMHATPAPLIAANASATVTLSFDGVPVPEDRLLGTVSLEHWMAADTAGLAGNGALALGVAHRAAVWTESPALLDEVAAARAGLLAADPSALPAARAACSALAVRAAAALAVHDGGRSVIRGSRGDRLTREAQFLLGFGSRPAIRDELLRTLAG